MKKHVRQMTNSERRILYSLVRNVNNWSFTDYSFKRVDERLVSKQDTIKAIKHGSLIEYHYKNGDHRVLIRGVHLIDRRYVACVVVSLVTQKVITVYVNEHHDHHYTLDWSKYDKSIDILKKLEGKVAAVG